MTTAPYKLPPATKTLWLAALRGGKYRQGIGRLTRDGLYCCLGVLADVLELTIKNTYALLDKDIIPLPIQHKLASMNDSGKSFGDIADWIEANL